MVKPALTNRYSNFNFPDYEFREFPKAVHHNGKVYVANDAEEEMKIKTTTRDYRAEALARAAELKLEIPEDWKLEKIQAFIKKKESDLEFERLEAAEVQPTDNKDASTFSTRNAEIMAVKRNPGRPRKE